MDARLAGARIQTSLVALLIGFVSIALACWFSAFYLPPFGDTDTLTRIAFLRGAGWGGMLDPLFMRDGAPYGALLEWTFPFNALTLLQGTLLGWNLASMLSGPASLVLLVAATWLASRQISCRALPIIPSMLSFMPVCLAYAQPGRMSHHDTTAALCILALGMSLRWWRSPGVAAASLAGMAASAALWESMEAVPMVAAAWAACMVATSAWPHRMRGTWAYGAGAMLVLAVALALDGPWPSFPLFSLHRLSLAHALGMAGASLGLVAAHATARAIGGWRVLRKVAAASAVGMLFPTGAAAVIALMVPKPVHGPLFESYFWSSIGELANLWTNTSLVVSSLAVPLVTATCWGLVCCRGKPSPMRWLLLVVMIGAIAMSCAYVRLAVHAEALCVVLGGAMLGRLFCGNLARRLPHVLTMFAASCMLAHASSFLSLPETSVPSVSCRASSEWGAWLEHGLLPGTIVMADIWPSPSIVETTTTLRTVGGPYHGNSHGIEDAVAFMTSLDEEQSRRILESRRAGAVVLCTAPWYTSGVPWPAGSLARRLLEEHSPAWLVPMRGAPPSGLRAWKVVTPSSPQVDPSRQ